MKTYILAGYDHNGAFQSTIEQWQKRAEQKGDVEILYPKPNETMEQLAARIKSPANIIVEAHGSKDGHFAWDQTQGEKAHNHYYGELFQFLPAGIESITVDGCYGESAVRMRAAVPPGTILQSRIGSKTTGLGSNISGQYVHEISQHNEITPLSIMLEALDATSPDIYETNNNLRKARGDEKINVSVKNFDPNDVLPHTIGIGGRPPIVLDLNQKMAELSTHGQSGQSWARVAAHVKSYFDTDDGFHIDKRGISTNSSAQKRKLNAQIDEVAQKLAHGDGTRNFTLEEKRIGYALTIVSLYESGEIAKLTEQARATVLTEPVVLKAEQEQATFKSEAVTNGAKPHYHELIDNDSQIKAGIMKLIHAQNHEPKLLFPQQHSGSKIPHR